MTRLSTYIIFCTGILLIFAGGCGVKDPGTVTDIDGNVYKTIKIGKQVWMVENLKVTRYRNGDTIPNITDAKEWGNQKTGAYCNYDNNDTNAAVYGRLYNWFAVKDRRNIAPKGWHVPSFEELRLLIDYLGGEDVAAGKMKEAGLEHWLIPNSGATNESGFTALPGGYRFNHNGEFYTMGSNGYWWTTTLSYEMYAWSPRLFLRFANVTRDHTYMTYGFSVRCVKN